MTDPIEQLRRYARDLQAEVHPGRARGRVDAAMTRQARRPRRVVLVVLASTLLLLFSNVALAAAADPAVPGDALYGLDRTYERIADAAGLGGMHAGERLDEAAVLFERGRAAEALDLVNEAFDELLATDDPSAAFADVYGAHSGDFRPLLDDLKTAIAGGASGHEISEIARCLVTTVSLPDSASDRAKDNPNRGGKHRPEDCTPSTSTTDAG